MRQNLLGENHNLQAFVCLRLHSIITNNQVLVRNKHRPYGKLLKEKGFTMTLRGVNTSAASVYQKLVRSINAVYRDVIKTGFIDDVEHPEEYELFHNDLKVVDGPW